jgi:uncharacterized protein (DUF2062 family)
MRFFSGRYEFEVEVLVRASWKGVGISAAPIDVYYPPREERVSHFRPFKDFARISILNTVLVLLALLWYHPRRLYREYSKKSLRDIYWEAKATATSLSNFEIAAAIAFGVFMGIFPIWGYQLLVGFIIAHLLSLNKTIFFIAANISLPPMIPFIIYLSYVLGGYMMGDGSWAVDVELSISGVKGNLVQYLIGAVGLSCIAGLIAGALSYMLLVLFKRK